MAKKVLLDILYRAFIIITIPFAIVEIVIKSLLAFFIEAGYLSKVEYIFVREHLKYGLRIDDIRVQKYIDSIKK